jgi:hypothetical protein
VRKILGNRLRLSKRVMLSVLLVVLALLLFGGSLFFQSRSIVVPYDNKPNHPLPLMVEQRLSETGYRLYGAVDLPDGSMYVISHQQTANTDWCIGEWYTAIEFKSAVGFYCRVLFQGFTDTEELGRYKFSVSTKNGTFTFRAENAQMAKLKQHIITWFMYNVERPVYVFFDRINDRNIVCDSPDVEGRCYIIVRSEQRDDTGVLHIEYDALAVFKDVYLEKYEQVLEQYDDFIPAFTGAIALGRAEKEELLRKGVDPTIRSIEISIPTENTITIDNPNQNSGDKAYPK